KLIPACRVPAFRIVALDVIEHAGLGLTSRVRYSLRAVCSGFHPRSDLSRCGANHRAEARPLRSVKGNRKSKIPQLTSGPSPARTTCGRVTTPEGPERDHRFR